MSLVRTCCRQVSDIHVDLLPSNLIAVPWDKSETLNSMLKNYCTLFLLAVPLFQSCAPRGESRPPDSRGSISEMKYPYELREDQQEQLFDKVERLRQGEPYSDVVKSLGPPFEEVVISTKTDDQPRGVRLEYYVKKLQGPVNEKTDRSVIVEFNNDKKLVRVAVRNLPELFKRLTGVSATQTYWDDTNNGIEVEEREPSGVPVKRPLTFGTAGGEERRNR